MKLYKLKRVQYLPLELQEAWEFFSSPLNLSRITPPNMGFEITKVPGSILTKGMEIEYRVRPLFGISVKWVTVIGDVQPPNRFTDIQQTGPYKSWMHTHNFEPVAGGVKMTDEVLYAMPLGLLGRMVHSLVVEDKLQAIFDFRRNALVEIFGKYKV